ncbi:RcnB family protein [Sphingomonas sp.]|uniref:RcnB family protein n=1 Tax=Sphingomonas sp. TaxID=28214 RepID=UPI002B58D7E9|nr:RcnB family protein [Sphingomonas sp.]HWK36295.1 RcnB family protein [Sphingomonas sp.]
MKKAILSALIAATALAPIAASAQEWNGRGGNRGGNASAGQSRGDRGNGGQRQNAQQPRPAQAQPQQPRQQFQPQQQRSRPTLHSAQDPNVQIRNGAGQPATPQWRGNGAPGNPGNGTTPPRQWQGNRNPGAVGNPQTPRPQWQGNGNRGGVNNGMVNPQRPSDAGRNNRSNWNRDNANRPTDNRGNWNGNNANRNNQWNRGNPGWNDNRGNPGRGGGNWNRSWRGDNRYNWQDWRSRNRNLYRLPRYYAPRGWSYGYQRFGIGMSLSALLFSQSYWIDDPWEYRLPEAYGPYRWVRYYNDAMLVDLDTGEVVDVIYDIFW